jgi:uncharacterized membrane protein
MYICIYAAPVGMTGAEQARAATRRYGGRGGEVRGRPAEETQVQRSVVCVCVLCLCLCLVFVSVSVSVSVLCLCMCMCLCMCLCLCLCLFCVYTAALLGSLPL